MNKNKKKHQLEERLKLISSLGSSLGVSAFICFCSLHAELVYTTAKIKYLHLRRRANLQCSQCHYSSFSFNESEIIIWFEECNP